MLLRYNPEFIEDLKTECMSHSDISRKFGVTRERVRQLALQLLSQTGREKQSICTIRRATPRNGKFPDELLKVWNRARNYGFTVEKIVSIWWHGMAMGNQLLINGHHCLIHAAKRSSQTRGNQFYFRFSIRPKTLNPEGFTIAVAYLDQREEMYVIPNRLLRNVSCVYIPTRGRYSTYKNTKKRVNVNWFDYLNRWELLHA